MEAAAFLTDSLVNQHLVTCRLSQLNGVVVTIGELFADGVDVDEKAATRDALRQRLKKTGTAHLYPHEAAKMGRTARIEWFLEAGGDVVSYDDAAQHSTAACLSHVCLMLVSILR